MNIQKIIKNNIDLNHHKEALRLQVIELILYFESKYYQPPVKWFDWINKLTDLIEADNKRGFSSDDYAYTELRQSIQTTYRNIILNNVMENK